MSDSIAILRNVRMLNFDHLGLENLPDSLVKLEKLAYLDIRFNKINIKKQMPILTALKQLKVIKMYGCDFDEKSIQTLQEQYGITVLYTKDQLLQESNVDFGQTVPQKGRR
ncbi:MAG: hypothetical protein AAF206_04390 [Bacteroidota bacterium]